MDAARRPWDPDRRWADPLLALLALLAVLAVGLALRSRAQAERRPAPRASLQARLTEVLLAGPGTWTGLPVKPAEWARAEAQLKAPWDRALLGVLLAESGDPARARALAAPAGPAWDAAFSAAYEGGPLPDRPTREAARTGLGGGYAAVLLEARLQDREGGGEALRMEARRVLSRQALGLAAFVLGVMVLAAGGLATGLYLGVARPRPARPLPAWELSGRAAALVFLLWFLAFFAAGNLAALLLSPWPSLRWAVVPLATLGHASAGVALLARAEGLGLRELWRKVAPAPPDRRDLGWAAAFLGLAVLMVLAVSLATGPFLKPDQSPQRDLQELLRGLRDLGPTLLMFGVVAGLAPAFEELLFRGFLLPVLARRAGMGIALLGSALLFGAIHLQPAGLPTLATLGLAMGLAFRHRGSLWPPLLLHGCWNGALFLLMRAFA